MKLKKRALKKRERITSGFSQFHDWVIENFKIIIITRPDDPDYMNLRFERRKKRPAA